MDAMMKEKCAKELNQRQIEIRQLVIDGLKQMQEDKTKDFNDVCDRLEKKYIDAAV